MARRQNRRRRRRTTGNAKRLGRRQRMILKYRRAIARYERKLDRTIKSVVKDMRGVK